jgi:hypothetical protein
MAMVVMRCWFNAAIELAAELPRDRVSVVVLGDPPSAPSAPSADNDALLLSDAHVVRLPLLSVPIDPENEFRFFMLHRELEKMQRHLPTPAMAEAEAELNQVSYTRIIAQ